MRLTFRRHIRRYQRKVTRLCLIVVAVIGILGMAFFRCRPIMTAFAESQAVWEATMIANRTAAQVLQGYSELCSHCITVVYDGDQRVSAVQTDSAVINSVRTAMTDRAMTAMEEFSTLSVGLPLGTLTGWDWFSGFGPLLTFPISFTATVLSDVSSAFTVDGINQSIYCVMVHLEISLYVISPAGRTSVGTRVSYPMAEAVLLGDVPDNLTEVYGDDQSLLGQIFDYGTSQ